jgi:4-amino-4-deoxy-L-arabinose transferase-like glycosyltransferase
MRRPPLAAVPRWFATPLAAMLGVSLLTLFPGFGQGDVRLDGARYAWVARWIVESGQWLTLYDDRGQTPYFNKPPLQFWLMAASMHVFGVGTWAVKIVTPVFALGCVCLTYAIVRLGATRAVAATAGIVLATSYTFFRHGVGVRLDPGVAFFVLLALYAGMVLLARPGPRTLQWPWVVMGAACGLGAMLKSPQSLLPLPILAIAFAWAGSPGRGLLLNWRWVISLSVAAAIWLPWHLYMWRVWGDAFIDQYFGHEMFARFDGPTHRREPIHHYVVKLLEHYWPWLPLAAWGAWLLWRRARRDAAGVGAAAVTRPLAQLTVVWLTLWFITAHLVTRKYERYLIPWYPAAGLAAAVALRATPAWPLWRRVVMPNAACVCVAIVLAIELTGVSMHRTSSPAIQAAAEVIARDDPGERLTLLMHPAVGDETRYRLLFYLDADLVVAERSTILAASPGTLVALSPDQAALLTAMPPAIELSRDRTVVLLKVR